jgi:hypothetical protein
VLLMLIIQSNQFDILAQQIGIHNLALHPRLPARTKHLDPQSCVEIQFFQNDDQMYHDGYDPSLIMSHIQIGELTSIFVELASTAFCTISWVTCAIDAVKRDDRKSAIVSSGS